MQKNGPRWVAFFRRKTQPPDLIESGHPAHGSDLCVGDDSTDISSLGHREFLPIHSERPSHSIESIRIHLV